jgi:lysylphosphatidylglycerol synthetase-like protein (DUF2156 family)
MSRRLVVLLAWALTMLAMSVVLWRDYPRRKASGLDVALLDASVIALVLAAVSAAIIGAVLVSRRPRRPDRSRGHAAARRASYPARCRLVMVP